MSSASAAVFCRFSAIVTVASPADRKSVSRLSGVGEGAGTDVTVAVGTGLGVAVASPNSHSSPSAGATS